MAGRVFPRSYNLRCTKDFVHETVPKMPDGREPPIRERQRHERGRDRDTQRAVSPLRRQSARDDEREEAAEEKRSEYGVGEG